MGVTDTTSYEEVKIFRSGLDEKEVCETILAKLVQLKKRMDIPFLFCGVMTQAREYLKAYAYSEYPFFDMPGEAADYLKENYPRNVMTKLNHILKVKLSHSRDLN